jgi:hypothetical protein
MRRASLIGLFTIGVVFFVGFMASMLGAMLAGTGSWISYGLDCLSGLALVTAAAKTVDRQPSD